MKLGITDTDLKLFEDTFKYNIPKLSFPYSIKYGTETIAILGTNASWVNRRADLNIYLNKEIDGRFLKEFIPLVINKYIDYLHEKNLYSVSTSVAASDKLLLNILLNSNMNYYLAIPFNSLWNNKLETTYLFEHYPNMENQNIKLPENKSLEYEELTEKKELNDIIYLKNGYIAVTPKYFVETLNMNLEEAINEHINALQQRDRFSIPLGEDKYFIQKGNGNYGISKMVQNFSYILLNENFKYIGYCSILREELRTISIDIAIIPKYQGIGLGTLLLDAFYKELLDKGYVAIISYVFDFNESSKIMHSKLAEYAGTRGRSYYMNGKFWDMSIYVKSK